MRSVRRPRAVRRPAVTRGGGEHERCRQRSPGAPGGHRSPLAKELSRTHDSASFGVRLPQPATTRGLHSTTVRVPWVCKVAAASCNLFPRRWPLKVKSWPKGGHGPASTSPAPGGLMGKCKGRNLAEAIGTAMMTALAPTMTAQAAVSPGSTTGRSVHRSERANSVPDRPREWIRNRRGPSERQAPRQLIGPDQGRAGAPAWSPDGEHIVFVMERRWDARWKQRTPTVKASSTSPGSIHTGAKPAPRTLPMAALSSSRRSTVSRVPPGSGAWTLGELTATRSSPCRPVSPRSDQRLTGRTADRLRRCGRPVSAGVVHGRHRGWSCEEGPTVPARCGCDLQLGTGRTPPHRHRVLRVSRRTRAQPGQDLARRNTPSSSRTSRDQGLGAVAQGTHLTVNGSSTASRTTTTNGS